MSGLLNYIYNKLEYYNNFLPNFFLIKYRDTHVSIWSFIELRINDFFNFLSNFISNWVLSTNHRRIAVMYFVFTIISGFTGLILATIIRIELAYPGQSILVNNAEKYLTIISLHGVVMVFFMIIPIIFGAFGNFLIPTQLGIRDVAFPRLNSFMFWVTPSGFVMLLHIILFDKSYNLTYWLNYSELRYQLRRRFYLNIDDLKKINSFSDDSMLALRLKTIDTYHIKNKILYNTNNYNNRNLKEFFNINNLKNFFFDIFFTVYNFFYYNFFYNHYVQFIYIFNYSFISKFFIIKEILLYLNLFSYFIYFYINVVLSYLYFVFSIISFKIHINFLTYVLDIVFSKILLCKNVIISTFNSLWIYELLFFLKTNFFINYFTFTISFFQAIYNVICLVVFFFTDLINELTFFSISYFLISIRNTIFSYMYFLDFRLFIIKHIKTKLIYDENVLNGIFSYDNNSIFINFKYDNLPFSLSSFFLNIYSNNVYFDNYFYNNLSLINKNDIDFNFFKNNLYLNFDKNYKKEVREYRLLNFINFSYYLLETMERDFWFSFFYLNYFSLKLILKKNFLLLKKCLLNYFYWEFLNIFYLIFDFFNLSIFTLNFFFNYFIFCYKNVIIFDFFCFIKNIFNKFMLTFVFNETYYTFSYIFFFFKYFISLFFPLNFFSFFYTLPTSFFFFFFNSFERLLVLRNLNYFLDLKFFFISFYLKLNEYLFMTQLFVNDILEIIMFYKVSFSISLRRIFFFSLYSFQLDNLFFKIGLLFWNMRIFFNELVFYFLFNTGIWGILYSKKKFIYKNKNNDNIIIIEPCRSRFEGDLQGKINYYRNLFNSFDNYLLDWQEIKFEREIWRSADDMSIARRHWLMRKKYFANFYEPETLISKVSIWLPNHLIPGWAFITPYSSRLRYTSLGKVDIALVVVLVASLGSVFSSVNYVITYRYIGSPIFKNRKELRSFFVDGLLVASRMMILANPALIIGIILLLSDRHFGTSVFDFSGGGDTILFQHLFWFFGHPEVYIIIIPCFGFMNSLLPYYLKKRLSGRLSLQFSMYTIAVMGFAVWGHHMYMVGLANSVRTLYSTMTVMISVPASTKILHWCVTIINSTITCDVGFLFLLSFMYFFVLGGLSGMFVAHIGFDVMFHDTFFVIGHFHVMLAGAAMSCVFAAFYFYFPAIFGIKYSRFFAYLHFAFYLSGQLLTLIPMFWLGYAGMPRRIMDYPSVFGGWHSIISSGHLLTLLGFIFFLIMIFDSIYESRAPISKTRGVSRLNTRLSLYVYEVRKLKYNNSKNLNNNNTYKNKNIISKNLSKLELENFEYTFLKK